MDEQLNANSPISQFENVVSVNDIEQPAPELTLPTEGQFQPIESFLAPSVEDQQNEQQVQQQQSNVDELLSSIQSSFGNLATQGATQVQLEEQAGIGRMSKELTDVENEIRQKSLAFRREQEAIQTVPGLSAAQRAARLGDVSRRNNMERADLEVIRQARSNSLSNAQAMIDRKVELQFGDEKRRLEGLQFIYNENKDKLTQKQNELLQSKIKKEERAFELAKGKYQTLEQEKLQLVRNAQANGAGNGVMSAILKSQTLEDAYRNAGSFGLSIDDKIRQMQLQKARAEISSLSSNAPVQEKISATNNLKQMVSELATMKGKKGAVGTSFQKFLPRLFGAVPKTEADLLVGTPAADFEATFNMLKDSLAMENLGKLKGPMSDKDIAFLRNTATALSLSSTEEEFDRQLTKLNERLNQVLIDNGYTENINPYTSMSDDDFLRVFQQELNNASFFNR